MPSGEFKTAVGYIKNNQAIEFADFLKKNKQLLSEIDKDNDNWNLLHYIVDSAHEIEYKKFLSIIKTSLRRDETTIKRLFSLQLSYTPFVLAAQQGRMEIIKPLLDLFPLNLLPGGENIYKKVCQDLLPYVAAYNDDEVVTQFCKISGAELDKQIDGNNLLHLIATVTNKYSTDKKSNSRHWEVEPATIKWLVENKGIDSTQKDNEEAIPLRILLNSCNDLTSFREIEYVSALYTPDTEEVARITIGCLYKLLQELQKLKAELGIEIRPMFNEQILKNDDTNSIELEGQQLEDQLKLASQQGKIKEVQSLLASVKSEQQVMMRQELLAICAAYNDPAVVEEFCNTLKADIKAVYPDNENILHRIASIVCDNTQPLKPNTIKWLIAQGIDPTHKDDDKLVPLDIILYTDTHFTSLNVECISALYVPNVDTAYVLTVAAECLHDLWEEIQRLRAIKAENEQTNRKKRKREDEAANSETTLPDAKRVKTAANTDFFGSNSVNDENAMLFGAATNDQPVFGPQSPRPF